MNGKQPEDNLDLKKEGAQESDSDSGGERVFDISEDNIKPFQDSPADNDIPITASAPINLTVSPKSPAKIPIQDFSESLAKATAVKPNIPAPIENAHVPSEPDPQSAVSSVFPQKVESQAMPQTIPSQNPNAKPEPAKTAANPNVKRLRTYEGDVAEVLAHTKTSTASIAIAESKRKEGSDTLRNTEEKHTVKKLLLILASLIFICIGVAGAYYLYGLSPLAAKPAPAPAVQIAASLVPSDSQAVLTITNPDPLTVESQIESEVAKPQSPDTIKEIILEQSMNGQLTRLTGPDMVQLMSIPAPDILTRSLGDQWMLGVYADASGNKSVFVVATTDFFQNSFAGMLQWESVMPDDLKQYLYPDQSASTQAPAGIANIPGLDASSSVQALNNPLDTFNSILPMASGTASGNIPLSASSSSTTGAQTMPVAKVGTSSQAIQPLLTIRGQFQDRIVMNKDVREFVTDTGTPIFLYSFIDNERLVVAPNEAALSAIISRLEQQTYVR